MCRQLGLPHHYIHRHGRSSCVEGHIGKGQDLGQSLGELQSKKEMIEQKRARLAQLQVEVEAAEGGDAPAAAPAAPAGGLGLGGLALAVNGGGTMTKLFLDEVKDKGATGADDDDAPLPSPLPAPGQRGGAPHRAGDKKPQAKGAEQVVRV